MDESENQDSSAWRKHVFRQLGIAIPAAIVLLSLMQILVVSYFDLSTALVLLSVADRTQIVLSVVVTLLLSGIPAAATFRIAWLWRRLVVSYTSRDLRRIVVFVALATATTISIISIASLVVLAGMTIGLSLLALLRYAKHREEQVAAPRGADGADLFGAIILGMGLIGMVFVLLMNPWTDRELIGFTDQPSEVGYVIGQSGSGTLILDKHHHAEWVSTETIATRTICANNDGWWDRTLIDFIRPSKYAKCK